MYAGIQSIGEAQALSPHRSAEDVAHAVSFLVSEGAGFTSGQVLYVAGGPQS
jgi:3-oxoacyl-[acyl-carrier protein] reductase